jgi:hypothetical protein
MFSSKFMKRFCKIKDIQSVVYGPQSYTFRAYKLNDLLQMFDVEKAAQVMQEDSPRRPQNKFKR